MQRTKNEETNQHGRLMATHARHATSFVYEMRRILSTANLSGETRINDIERFLNGLRQDRNFIRYVESQDGPVDSYSLVLYFYNYPRNRFKSSATLESIDLIDQHNYSTVHALLAIREWMNKDYFLTAAHAVEALLCEKFEQEATNKKPKAPTDKQIKNALRKDRWKSYVQSLLATNAANARHQNSTRRVKAKAIELYESAEFASPHAASIKIESAVRQYARSIGATLSPDRGRKTIYDWLREHHKRSKRRLPACRHA